MTRKASVTPPAAAAATAAATATALAFADTAVLLARIDERTKTIEGQLGKLVTQEEFRPVKQVVYGMVGFALLAMLGGIVAMVLP